MVFVAIGADAVGRDHRGIDDLWQTEIVLGGSLLLGRCFSL
jgi:hypothetical protein